MKMAWELGVKAACAVLLSAVVLLLAGPAAAAEWQTYLAETFDGAETMFYSGQAGEAFYSVDDGRYLIDGLGTGSDSLSALTDGMYYYYAEASCEMLQSSAGDLAFCGMVFHYNKKTANKLSYYVFYVYGDGYYGAKRVIGDQVEIVLPLTRTTELIPARPNTLGVDAQGTRFDLYINGKYVDGFTDVRIDGGGFGFYISKHTKAAFDDFVVKIEQRGGLQPAAEPNSVEGAIAPEAAQDDFGQYQFPDIPRDPNRPVYPWEVGVDKSQKAKRQRLEREREEAAGQAEPEPEPELEQEPEAAPGESGGVPSEHGKLQPGADDAGDADGADAEALPPDERPSPPADEEPSPPAEIDAAGAAAEEVTDVKLVSQPPPAPFTHPQDAAPEAELDLPQGEELLIPDLEPQAPPEENETAVRPPAPEPAPQPAADDLQLPEPATEPAAPQLELVPADPEPAANGTSMDELPLEQEAAAEPEPEPEPEALPPAPAPLSGMGGQPGGPQAQAPQEHAAAAAPAEEQAATIQPAADVALNRMRSRSGDWEDVNSDSDVVEEHRAEQPAVKPADPTPEAAAQAPAEPQDPEAGVQHVVAEEAEPPAAESVAAPAEDVAAPAELALYPEDGAEAAPAEASGATPPGENTGAQLSFEGLPPELENAVQPTAEAADRPPLTAAPEDQPAAPAAAEPLPLVPANETTGIFGVAQSELTVVSDDFSEPRWPVSENGTSTYRYFGAAYEINNLAAETMAISYQDAQLADFELALDAEYLDGQSYVGYGLAARFSVVNGVVSYYGFFISQSGEFLLLKVLNGEEVVLKDWTASSLLAPAKPGRLKLEVEGTALRAYINGELVAAVQDSDLTGGGYALLVGPGCAARFDNLNLRGVTLATRQALGAAGI